MDEALEDLDLLRSLTQTFQDDLKKQGKLKEFEGLGPVAQAKILKDHMKEELPKDKFNEFYSNEVG